MVNNRKMLFIKRLLAFVFDIFLISILVSFICMPFLDYTSIDNLSDNAKQIMVDYDSGSIDTITYINYASSILYRLAKKQGVLSLATIFFNILYFVVYQFYNKGQTIGKKLLGIRVVSSDSRELTVDNYIYRSFVVNSILVDMVVFAFLIFATQGVWFNSVMLLRTINYIILFVCSFMVVFNKDGRGLQDLVGNTKVIQCRK